MNNHLVSAYGDATRTLVGNQDRIGRYAAPLGSLGDECEAKR